MSIERLFLYPAVSMAAGFVSQEGPCSAGVEGDGLGGHRAEFRVMNLMRNKPPTMSFTLVYSPVQIESGQRAC